MIVSDTDFLSAFGKIDRIDLIFKVFKTKEITITKSVYDELKESPVFDKLLPYFSAKENNIKVKEASIKDIPVSLGKGERASISLAKDKKAKLLMDDRDAGEYAESKGVDVIDIPAFLFHCKESNTLSVSEIKSIINNLKDKDHYEFEAKVKEELLKKRLV